MNDVFVLACLTLLSEGSSTVVCLFMCHAAPDLCERQEGQRVACLSDAGCVLLPMTTSVFHKIKEP